MHEHACGWHFKLNVHICPVYEVISSYLEFVNKNLTKKHLETRALFEKSFRFSII